MKSSDSGVDSSLLYCEVGALGDSVEDWLKKRGRGIRPKLTREQVEELTACFSIFDSDGSGEIDADEIFQAMRMLSLASHKKEVTDLMALWDDDGTGSLCLPEFIEMMTAKMDMQRRLEEAREEGLAADRGSKQPIVSNSKVGLQSFARAFRRRNIIAEMMRGNYDSSSLTRMMAPADAYNRAETDKKHRKSRITIIGDESRPTHAGAIRRKQESKLVQMGAMPPASEGKGLVSTEASSRELNPSEIPSGWQVGIQTKGRGKKGAGGLRQDYSLPDARPDSLAILDEGGGAAEGLPRLHHSVHLKNYPSHTLQRGADSPVPAEPPRRASTPPLARTPNYALVTSKPPALGPSASLQRNFSSQVRPSFGVPYSFTRSRAARHSSM